MEPDKSPEQEQAPVPARWRWRLGENAVRLVLWIVSPTLAGICIGQYKLIPRWLSPEVESLILCLLLASLIIVLAYLADLSIRLTLKHRFGLLWDRSRWPYCPKCRLPLSGMSKRNFPELIIRTGMDCPGCGKVFAIQDDLGHGPSLAAVQAKL